MWVYISFLPCRLFRRLNQDTMALRNPQERARTAGRLCVELHGKSGGVYTHAGGPSNARAQSESWRMPFTQAGEMPMEETVRSKVQTLNTKP
jgi:hypothetical protein